MDKNLIINKIKKCMALGNSTNAEEAAVALEKAQSLMEKYSIDMVDVSISDVANAEEILCKAKKPAQYFIALASSVSKAFGCRYVLSRGLFYKGELNTQTTVEFIGIAPQPEIAAYAFSILNKALVNGRKEFLKSIPKQTKPRNKARRADVWALGWVSGVSRKVKAFAISDENKKTIDTWVDRNMKLIKGKTRDIKLKGNKATNDYIAGFDEGGKQDIYRPVKGKSSSQNRLCRL